MNHQLVGVRGKQRERMFKEISEICCRINGSYSHPKASEQDPGFFFFVIKDTADQGMKYRMQMF